MEEGEGDTKRGDGVREDEGGGEIIEEREGGREGEGGEAEGREWVSPDGDGSFGLRGLEILEGEGIEEGVSFVVSGIRKREGC